MKGIAPSPQWPTSATQTTTTPAIAPRKPKTVSLIALALLDDYVSEAHAHGCDPYNTQAVRSKSDVWRRKPKRD